MADDKNAVCKPPRAIIRVVLPPSRAENQPGEAWIEDENGNVLSPSIPVLGRGSSRDRSAENGDTPTGVYQVTGTRNDGDQAAYGPNPRLVLKPVSGEVVDVQHDRPEVKDVRMHGGRNQNADLMSTHGCIRDYDDDEADVVDKLKEAGYLKNASAHDAYLTVDDLDYCPADSGELSNLPSKTPPLDQLESSLGLNQQTQPPDYTPNNAGGMCSEEKPDPVMDILNGKPPVQPAAVLQCSAGSANGAAGGGGGGGGSAAGEGGDSDSTAAPNSQEAGNENPPVLTAIKDRRESIMANTPAVFDVGDNPEVAAAPAPWYQISGFEEVTKNKDTIEKMAKQYNMDPDFVKAVVYMESTHGWYDRVDPYNKTIRPMNVHDTLWSQLGVTRDELEDPNLNIATGVHILASIRDRTQDPSAEKIATLYNQLGATKVNPYGKTVAYYMEHKPWLAK